MGLWTASMTGRRGKRSRLERLSRRLTFGKFTLGRGHRTRRSRRLEFYQGEAFSEVPSFVRTLWDWLGNWWAWLVFAWLLSLVIYAGFGTSWFYIYDVEVVGIDKLTKQEIYNRSNLEGWSIFWLNPNLIAQKLEEEPWIGQAVVSVLPPNQAKIEVQERIPVAVWQSDATSYFVDQTGILFGIRNDASQMLVIRDLSNNSVELGGEVEPTAVHTVLELTRFLPERKGFDWEDGVGISFIADDGWRVIFGDFKSLPAKVGAFESFKSQVHTENKIEVLDLSDPEHPYYRISP
jgi:hypothetical protein